jgi:hypothetical protein
LLTQCLEPGEKGKKDLLRRQLELKIRNMNWLINKKSQLSIENKITIYKAINQSGPMV